MELDHSYHKSGDHYRLDPASGGRGSHTILKPIGFIGLGVFYVAVAGQGVPHLASLGLSETQISLALISGPLCGAVLQPIFGSWSDRYQSSWGRRKPFIIAGAIWLILSTLCLAWARSIVDVILSQADQQETRHMVLSIFSICTVFSMYAAVQSVQIGMRALITDGCSLLDQANANAWAGRYIGLGGVLGNLAALLDDLSRSDEEPECRTILMDMSSFTTICLILSLVVSCSFKTNDESASISAKASKPKGGHGKAKRWNLLKGTSQQFRMICLVQFFVWLGWFPFYFYTVTYVNGLSESQDSRGMLNEAKKRVWESQPAPRLGSFTFFTYSLVSLFLAMLLPYLTPSPGSSQPSWSKAQRQRRPLITMPRLWMISHAVFGICMLGTFFVKSASGTVVLFTVVGFSWAVSNWVPYALLGAEISRNAGHRVQDGFKADSGVANGEKTSADAGLIYGLHGLAICVPQIFMALMMGAVSMYTEPESAEKRHLKIVWTFRAGGIFAFIAMFCTMWVRDLGDSREGSGEVDESCEILLSDR